MDVWHDLGESELKGDRRRLKPRTQRYRGSCTVTLPSADSVSTFFSRNTSCTEQGLRLYSDRMRSALRRNGMLVYEP